MAKNLITKSGKIKPHRNPTLRQRIDASGWLASIDEVCDCKLEEHEHRKKPHAKKK